MKHYLVIGLLILSNLIVCSEINLEEQVMKPELKDERFSGAPIDLEKEGKKYIVSDPEYKNKAEPNPYYYQDITNLKLQCNLIFITNTEYLPNSIKIEFINKTSDTYLSTDRLYIKKDDYFKLYLTKNKENVAFKLFYTALCYGYTQNKQIMITQSALLYLTNYATDLIALIPSHWGDFRSGMLEQYKVNLTDEDIQKINDGYSWPMKTLFKSSSNDPHNFKIIDLYIALDTNNPDEVDQIISLLLPEDAELKQATLNKVDELIKTDRPNQLVALCNKLYQGTVQISMQEEQQKIALQEKQSQERQANDLPEPPPASDNSKDARHRTIGSILYKSAVQGIKNERIRTFFGKNEPYIGWATWLGFKGLTAYSTWQTLNWIGSLRAAPFLPQTPFQKIKFLWNALALLSTTYSAASTWNELYGYTKAGVIRMKEKFDKKEEGKKE